FCPQPRIRIPRHCHVIYVCQCYSRFFQAIPNRRSRKTCGIFHAIEPLFFHRRNELPVAHNRRRCVSVIRVYPKNVHFVWISVYRSHALGQAGSAGHITLAPFIQNKNRPRSRPRRFSRHECLPDFLYAFRLQKFFQWFRIFEKTLFQSPSQSSTQPLLPRQSERPLLLCSNFCWQQILQRIQQQCLLPLFHPPRFVRQCAHELNQRCVEQRHSHFQRSSHAHRIRIAQQRARHIASHFHPAYSANRPHPPRFIRSALQPSHPSRFQRGPVRRNAARPETRLNQLRQILGRKQRSRKKVRMRQALRIAPGCRCFRRRVSRHRILQSSAQQSSCRFPQSRRKKSCGRRQSFCFRNTRKSRIASKQLITAKPRQRHLQPHFP